MMDKRIHRIISFILAVSLFFAGMYMEISMPETLFACDLTGKMAVGLASCHSDINAATICTTELPSMYGMELQPLGKYQHQYREANELLYLLCTGFGVLAQGKSWLHFVSARLFCQTQDVQITDYIHHADGKKRI